jgi:hypothetical protein
MYYTPSHFFLSHPFYHVITIIRNNETTTPKNLGRALVFLIYTNHHGKGYRHINRHLQKQILHAGSFTQRCWEHTGALSLNSLIHLHQPFQHVYVTGKG